jgi:hypothetical protein
MPESNLVERFRHVNTVQLDDANRSLTAAARRLLEYERYLDRLEHLKMRDQSLPDAVERRVGRSIRGNLADAQTVARLTLELAAELEELGAFEALFSSIDKVIEPGSVPALLSEQGPVLERWLEQSGMPLETWRWALQSVDWNELGARVEDGSIVVTQGKRTIAAITAEGGARTDAASFVARGFGLSKGNARVDNGDEPLRLSATEALDTVVQELISFYGARARRTAVDGVQVLPTGIWWVVVIIVIAAFLIVAGASIIILCDIGSITDRGVCDLGVALLLLGFLLAGVGLVGGKTTRPDPNDPDPGIPDPLG